MLKTFRTLLPYSRPFVHFNTTFCKEPLAKAHSVKSLRPFFRTYILTESMSQPQIVTAACCIIG
jgi:hypothetical protein